MRVLLSTYDSRGGVEPPVGIAVRVCAPPDCAQRLAEVGVPLVPVGRPVRPLSAELEAFLDADTPPVYVGWPARSAPTGRRGDGGRDAAARHGQPGKATGVRVNHAGSSNQGNANVP